MPTNRISLVGERAFSEGNLAQAAKGGHAAMSTSPKVTTVTLKHIAAKLAERHDMPKKQAETLMNDIVDSIVGHLKKGERIRLVGLGVLQVRKRAARMGRNPATGEPIQIKASKKVAFRAAKELKEAI
jgi:DNA-binding protein HU-beta